MILTITLKIRYAIVIGMLLLSTSPALAQSKVFANSIVDSQNVNSAANAVDSDLTTDAQIMANSGLALGIGAYSGVLEVEFPEALAPNTTSFVKIDTEDDILTSLLGGNIGGLLADIAGTLLIGNQEFTVEAKNGGTTVLSRASNSSIGFSNDDLRVVTDANNDYFLAVAPSNTYDRIKITNRIGSLVGLGNTKALDVAGAYTSNGTNDCGSPSYTSFNGNGLTLDLLNIGGAGVTNPGNAIDGDASTFSELGLGILGVAADIEQTIYFDTPSHEDESFFVQLRMNPALLELGILNNIQFEAKDGPNNIVSSNNLSSLINLDVLTLLQNNSITTIEVRPGTNADRLTVKLSSLLNVALAQEIEIFEVFVAPSTPTISEDSENPSICFNTSADLVATTSGSSNREIRWYDAAENGNLLATVNSGEAFTTPNLTTDTTYYVAAGNTTCPQESARVAVTVNVVDIPEATDINVSGNEFPICSSNDAILIPSSTIDGDFSWYFDANGINEITNGLVSGATTYSIDSNGTLRISGLDEVNSPYTYYVKITEDTAVCENAPGDYKEVIVEIVDSNFDAVVAVNSIIDIDDLVNIFQGDANIALTGNVTGDVSEGDLLSLSLNDVTSGGAIDSNLNFNIDIDGNDLLAAVGTGIESTVSNGICTITNLIPIDIPELPVDNILQIFCETELAVVADLDVSRDDVLFFESLTSDVLVDANTPLVDGQVYFAGILDIPISILSRVEITVEILSVTPPTTNSTNQNFCNDSNAVIGDIQVNEPDVKFYDSAAGGNELDPSTPLEDGRTYYVANVASGCESVSRLAITVSLSDAEPILLSGQFENVCLNRDYTYETANNKENYVWVVTGGTITDGGTLTDNFVSVRWTDLQDTEVSLSYTDATNCASDMGITLAIATISCGEVLGEEFALIVYNEFTPNNDGFNDFFKVEGLEAYSNSVDIYNRNGGLVFSAINYQNDWNGIANFSGDKGKYLPSGTYFYKINIPELDRTLVGWLQLAR
ncbi:gliding motility-associated C-terminal domain-containing protein [Aurantibacter crassamenti]|uniref:gliding motility-associated C-terminal domain-containing protein n=1 Tax=Aurantibacter crassamenti TaxID=1837375 RepID=UPI00193A8748|nr:gliding motility-associated C-terminal domain-containing protein [Aurantibacter crassamenti]MBM1107735.1 gliding motility-associated C-terminal domain-containing protein [Aurantibacter crassamenti]